MGPAKKFAYLHVRETLRLTCCPFNICQFSHDLFAFFSRQRILSPLSYFAVKVKAMLLIRDSCYLM